MTNISENDYLEAYKNLMKDNAELIKKRERLLKIEECLKKESLNYCFQKSKVTLKR